MSSAISSVINVAEDPRTSRHAVTTGTSTMLESLNLSDLPTESSEAPSGMLGIMQALMRDEESGTQTQDPARETAQKTKSDLKEVVIATIVLAVLTLPLTDNFISTIMPSFSGGLALYGFKIALFFILFFILIKIF
jgi:hypothetical protein